MESWRSESELDVVTTSLMRMESRNQDCLERIYDGTVTRPNWECLAREAWDNILYRAIQKR